MTLQNISDQEQQTNTTNITDM